MGSNLVKSTDCTFVGSSFDLLALAGRYFELTGVSVGELLLSLDNEEHVETLTTEQSESSTLTLAEAHSFTFTEQPGDLSTLTNEHREFVILIKELCDCFTSTAAFELLLSLIQTNVLGDLEAITVDSFLTSLISGSASYIFIAY